MDCLNKIIDYCKKIASTKYNLEKHISQNYKIIYNELIDKNYDKKNVQTLLNGIIYTCIAIDGNFSKSEDEFMSSFFNLTDYDINYNTICQYYNEEAINISVNSFSIINDALKINLANICIGIFFLDNKLDKEENEFIQKISMFF